MANVQRQMQAGFIAMPAALAVQLLGTLIIARQLGTDRFGVFSIVFAAMTIANFVSELGLGAILTKLVAEERHPPAHHVALALPLISILAACGAIVQFVILWFAFSEADAHTAAVLSAVNTLVFGASVALGSTLRGVGRVGQWMLGFFSQKVVFLVLVLVLFKFVGVSVTTSVAAWTFSSGAIFVYYVVAVWKREWHGQLRWNLREAWDVVKAATPIGLTTAANQVAQNLDTLILAALLRSHDVGIYALGQRLLNPVRNVLHGAVTTPTFPGLCKLATQDREKFAAASGQICRIQWWAGLVLAVGAVVATPLVVPIVLPQFTESIPVVAITVWALAPGSLTLQLRYSYTAVSRQGPVSRAQRRIPADQRRSAGRAGEQLRRMGRVLGHGRRRTDVHGTRATGF